MEGGGQRGGGNLEDAHAGQAKASAPSGYSKRGRGPWQDRPHRHSADSNSKPCSVPWKGKTAKGCTASANHARKGHLIFVLQGFFDDSGSHASDPYYVLAGFISTVESWESFSDEWRAKLNEYPGLQYFKMSEANAMKGQFRSGWNPRTRDQRVFELAEIVNKHAMVLVTSWLKRSDFDDFSNGIEDTRGFSDPYFLCFYQLVFAVNSFQLANSNAECDLVFDEQGKLGPETLLGWEAAKIATVSDERLNIFENLSLPLFRSDLKSLPLQAADMLAWTVRAAQGAGGTNNLNLLARAVIEQLRPLEQINRHWSRDDSLYGHTRVSEESKAIGDFLIARMARSCR